MNHEDHNQEFMHEVQLLREYSSSIDLDELAIQRSKHRLMTRVNRKKSISAKQVISTFLALLVVLFSGMATVSASYGSLPGDALFPLREYLEEKVVEKAADEQAKVILKLEHLEKKVSQFEEKNRVDDSSLAYVNSTVNEIQSENTFNDEAFDEQLKLFLTNDGFMNKKAVISTMIGIALAAQPSLDQENLDSVNPGVLPSSSLYVFDLLEEQFELLLARNPEKNIAKRLEFALEKLAEAREMSESGEGGSADKALNRYERYVDGANDDVEDAEEDSKEELGEKIAEATFSHTLILDEVHSRASDKAKPSIEKAIEKSLKGNREAIESLGKKNESKGASIAAKQADKRLERIKKFTEAAKEEDFENVEEDLETIEDDVDLADSINDDADDEDEDTDEVGEKIKEVHQKHVEVLKNVYDNAPEQAQKGVGRALENAERNQEHFLEKLQERQERKAEKRAQWKWDDDDHDDDRDDKYENRNRGEAGDRDEDDHREGRDD